MYRVRFGKIADCDLRTRIPELSLRDIKVHLWKYTWDMIMGSETNNMSESLAQN